MILLTDVAGLRQYTAIKINCEQEAQSMGRGILFLTSLAIALLLIGGVFFPETSTMWLAATTQTYVYVRAILLVLLAAMLVTEPPRNKTFRTITGITSTVLGSWALQSTWENHMMLLDGMTILAASISLGIAALEYNPEELLDKASRAKHSTTA